MAESFLNPSSVAAILLLISCMLVWIGFKTVNPPKRNAAHTTAGFIPTLLSLRRLARLTMGPHDAAHALSTVSTTPRSAHHEQVLTATALAVAVGMDTIFRFPFWAVDADRRDNIQFHFFQSLSLVGGMLLLAVHGPGRLSLDSLPDKST